MKKSTSVEITSSLLNETVYFGDGRSFSWIEPSQCSTKSLKWAYGMIRKVFELKNVTKYAIEVSDDSFKEPNVIFFAMWLLLIRARRSGSLLPIGDPGLAGGRPRTTSISKLSRVNPFDSLPECALQHFADELSRIVVGD